MLSPCEQRWLIDWLSYLLGSIQEKNTTNHTSRWVQVKSATPTTRIPRAGWSSQQKLHLQGGDQGDEWAGDSCSWSWGWTADMMEKGWLHWRIGWSYRTRLWSTTGWWWLTMLIWQSFVTIGWPKEYKEYQEAKTKLSALKVRIYHFSLLIYLLIHLYIDLSTFSPSCADVSMRLRTLSILLRLLKPLIECLNVPHKLGGYERSPNRNNQPQLDLVASYS